ncbi:MAG: hypothetical protein LBR30_04635 [Clostridioides sp.]|jgi:uncharacterized BrkB/YihY/UPF0761 family membrane protein|nr:hypothetical protein [Clostridioides sp.]
MNKKLKIETIILLFLSILSLLFFSVTFFLSKLIFVFQNKDLVFETLHDNWIDRLPTLTKLVTFAPIIISIILFLIFIYILVKDNKKID